jgi:hypothetical protein
MMKTPRILPLLALSLLSACVVPTGPVEVTRFNRAAEGVPYGDGSFVVELAGESAADRSLSASPYVAAVTREMQRVGYRNEAGTSDVVAEIRFGASMIRPERRSPVSVGVGGSTGSYGSSIGLGVGINLGGGSAALLQTTLAVRRVCAPTLYCDRMRPVVSKSGKRGPVFSSVATYSVRMNLPRPRTKPSTCISGVPSGAFSLQGHCTDPIVSSLS